ncbi:MAG: hypothetical protein ABI472_04265 [Ginsengibacter sp.]
MNYFNTKTAAERYSKGRPGFHGNTIQHIKDYLPPDKKLDKALDIACGTGLSTSNRPATISRSWNKKKKSPRL